MSILDTNTTPPLALQVLRDTAAMQQQARQERAFYTAQANHVWANEYGHTPQEVLDAWGSNAADLCAKSAAFVTYWYSITGENLNPVPDGVTLTVNDDGTVTLDYPSSSSSASSDSSMSAE